MGPIRHLGNKRQQDEAIMRGTGGNGKALLRSTTHQTSGGIRPNSRDVVPSILPSHLGPHRGQGFQSYSSETENRLFTDQMQE